MANSLFTTPTRVGVSFLSLIPATVAISLLFSQPVFDIILDQDKQGIIRDAATARRFTANSKIKAIIYDVIRCCASILTNFRVVLLLLFIVCLLIDSQLQAIVLSPSIGGRSPSAAPRRTY